MKQFFMKLFRKKEEGFQIQALNRLRGEQIRDSEIESRHIVDRSINSIDIAVKAVKAEHMDFSTQSAFSANSPTTQMVTTIMNKTTWVKVYATRELRDPNSEYDAATSTFIPKEGGTYSIYVNFDTTSLIKAKYVRLGLFKNGALHSVISEVMNAPDLTARLGGTGYVDMSAGDRIELYLNGEKEGLSIDASERIQYLMIKEI